MSQIAAGKGVTSPNGPRVAWIWRALAIVAGLFTLAHLASGMHELTLATGDRGTLGASFDVFHEPADGFYIVTQVQPGSPLARVGVHTGDALHFDHAYDFYREFRSGETVGLTVRSGSQLAHHAVTAGPLPPMSQSALVFSILFYLTRFVTILVGIVIIVRGGPRVPSLLLGAGLISLGEFGATPTVLESTPGIYPVFIVAAMLIFELGPIPFFGFALAARQANGHRITARWKTVFWAYAAAKLAEACYIIWITLAGRSVASIGDTFDFDVALTDLGYLLALVVLIAAFRESRGDERTRFGFLLVASGLLITSLELVPFTLDPAGNNTPLAFAMLGGAVIGASVFAYALLRHRVIDLGFVVNRTMVFGLASAVLLCAFGVIEWAVDHVIALAGREGNSLIDAAIALVVFLAFHRVHDFVEKWVERLLFKRWQLAEAGLRRFVKEAAFVRNPDKLNEALTAALSRFTEGAEVALYLAGADGAYQRASGQVTGIAARIGVDDPLLVALRAEPKPTEPAEKHSTLDAALAAPMVTRNEIVGIVLLSRKPSDQSFRPDEIDLIGWATSQVSLDLHALKIEMLEASDAELRQTISTLEARNHDLQIALGARAPA